MFKVRETETWCHLYFRGSLYSSIRKGHDDEYSDHVGRLIISMLLDESCKRKLSQKFYNKIFDMKCNRHFQIMLNEFILKYDMGIIIKPIASHT